MQVVRKMYLVVWGHMLQVHYLYTNRIQSLFFENCILKICTPLFPTKITGVHCRACHGRLVAGLPFGAFRAPFHCFWRFDTVSDAKLLTFFLAIYLEKVLIIFILAKIEEKSGRNPGSFTKFKGG